MSSHHRRWFVNGIIALMMVMPVSAQEAPPAVDNASPKPTTYLDLRRSEDRTTQMIAERYFGLVKLQEWSDSKGQSKVMAKYVAHDPAMKWVKIEAVRGSGANRVVKEIQVPVEKLSKTSQSRVRQIDTLQKKLDELAAAAPVGEAGETENLAAQYGEQGPPMEDERGREPRPAGRRRAAVAQPREQRPPAQTPPGREQSSAAPEEFDPDPLGFAEMDLGPGPQGVQPKLVLPFGRKAVAVPENASRPSADQQPAAGEPADVESSRGPER